jgi:hypothetical protein
MHLEVERPQYAALRDPGRRRIIHMRIHAKTFGR